MTTVTVMVTIPVEIEVVDYEPGHPGDYGCRPEIAEAPYGSSFDIKIVSDYEDLCEWIYTKVDLDEVEDAYLTETENDMDPYF